MNYNEDGYTLQDVEDTINLVKESPSPNWNGFVDELVLDALEFYKEMTYTNGN